MSKFFFTLTLVFFFCISSINAQEKFVLEAELDGFEDSILFKINPHLPDMNADMDNGKSVYILNGKFRYEAHLYGPTMFSLRAMPKIPPDNPLDFEFVMFWAENKTMTLNGKKGNLEFADFTGSAIQDENEKLAAIGKEMAEENKIIKHSILTNNLAGKSRETLSKKYNENNVNIENQKLEFILNHPEYLSCLAQVVLYTNFMPDKLDKTEIANFYNKLTDEFKNNIYGKQIKEFISNEEMLYPLLGIGDNPYQFVLTDINDNTITLAELEGNYVLLDFWGSGCGPCRAEHKNYEKYSSKGFEILSVSQDQSKRLWKNAMEKDNMIWKSGWDSDRSITKMYRISYIPANFLITPEGKIIAKDIRGEELSNKLAELFEN